MKQAWLAFARTLLQPIEGWKALKRLHLAPQKFNSLVFFPALALAAVVRLLAAIFWQDLGLQQALPLALDTFCAYFFSYFLTLILIKVLLPMDTRDLFDTDFGKNFVASAMTSLTLFDVLCQGFPMLQPVFVFLPVWTIFSIVKGTRILGVDEHRRVQTDTILSALTIGLPFGCFWLLGEIFK